MKHTDAVDQFPAIKNWNCEKALDAAVIQLSSYQEFKLWKATDAARRER